MTNTLDKAKMKAFGQKLMGDISAMALGSLAYIGDKLDLFKQLAESGPITSEGFAERTGCDARYIREWLSAMAASGWIEYDPQTELFTLPPEHVPFLAVENHPRFMGGLLEAIVPFTHVTPAIMDCFQHGGGVAYHEHHPDMPRVIDRISAPHFNNFLTQFWLPKLLPAVHQRLTEGAIVADVGCGTGRALILMAKAYPNSQFTGYEPNGQSAEQAREMIAQAGVEGNAQIVNGAADAMPDQHYDFITTFDVIHDCVDPQTVINDIQRALKADGTYLMQEINASHHLEEMLHPLGRFFYSMSTMYCMTVSLAHGGAGIGTCMGEELPRQMCTQAGFSHFRKLKFKHPSLVLYEIRD
ncbi:MAG: class I SAM-dependent methyltransferase [Ardenticatenaceae bacterium]